MCIVLNNRLNLFFVLVFLAGIIPFCKGQVKGKGMGKNGGNIYLSGNATNSDTFINNMLDKNSQFFNSVISKPGRSGIQVIYTKIDRTKNGNPRFRDYSFNLDSGCYYYPASTVKLPVAALALQKLNELKIAGLNKNSTMITGTAGGRQTEVFNDPSAPDGRPTIAHYIKKILLVSDNDAFNRLYEFLGQEYINNTLQKMGYRNVQIIHRLDISLSEEENRHTNPVNFFDSTGRIIFQKEAENSKLVYAQRDTKSGKGYYKSGQLVYEPFDFSKKNRFTLSELHSVVKSIMFPETMPAKMRFNLTEEDYAFLRKYMSMMPRESKSPAYDTLNYRDTYVKFLYYGAEKGKSEPDIRIFNKVGDAYGFLIDGAYFADFTNHIEFLLSAVIYCNSDEIFNDDKYDYEIIGLPFMKNLGRVIYEYERTRVRKFKPSLSSLFFDYNY